jgi:FKBP-type peptidyl-prolyl cis-trans isomerase FklB
MKYTIIAVVLIALATGSMQAQEGKTVALKSRTDSISYLLGMNIGRSIKVQQIDMNLSVFSAAIKTAMEDKPLLLTDQQAQELYTSFQEEMMTKQKARQKVEGDKNKADGEVFLRDNKSKPGVTVLPSGLQYSVIKMGTGPKPQATDKVRVHYSGTLLNGKEFDSSYKRGEPAEFGVTGVIKGWVEALQLMPVGSKWKLFIPSDLAYGEGGAGGDIGPNAALIFEVELLAIVPPAADKDKAGQNELKVEPK